LPGRLRRGLCDDPRRPRLFAADAGLLHLPARLRVLPPRLRGHRGVVPVHAGAGGFDSVLARGAETSALRMNGARQKSRIASAALYVLLIGVALTMLLPLWWMMVTAVSGPDAVLNGQVSLWPRE